MKPKKFKRYCLICEDDRTFIRQTYHYNCNSCGNDTYVGTAPNSPEVHYGI